MKEKDPEYLKMLSNTSDAEAWRILEQAFKEISSLIFYLKLETEEDAIGSKRELSKPDKKGRSQSWTHHSATELSSLDIYDDGERFYAKEGGHTTKHHLTIPFINKTQFTSNKEDLIEAKELYQDIEELIDQKNLNFEILHKWARLNYLIGAIEMSWATSEPLNIQQKRSALSNIENTKDKHDIWFSHLYLALDKPPKRKRSEMDELLVKHVKHLIDLDVNPAKEWLIKLLDNNKIELSSRYSQTVMSRAKCQRIVEKNPEPPYPLCL